MGLYDVLNANEQPNPSRESAITSCAHLTWYYRDSPRINYAIVTTITREENIHRSERIICLYQEGEETCEKIDDTSRHLTLRSLPFHWIGMTIRTKSPPTILIGHEQKALMCRRFLELTLPHIRIPGSHHVQAPRAPENMLH